MAWVCPSTPVTVPVWAPVIPCEVFEVGARGGYDECLRSGGMAGALGPYICGVLGMAWNSDTC